MFQVARNLLRGLTRCFCSQAFKSWGPSKISIELMENRSVIALEGDNAGNFLDYLITNDIHLFEERSSLFAAMLNAQGFVLHDVLLYKREHPIAYYLECDRASAQALVAHMKIHKHDYVLKIENMDQNMEVWSVTGDMDKSGISIANKIGSDAVFAMDPRLELLGGKLIAPKSINVPETLRSYGFEVAFSAKNDYKLKRYQLGVGEGNELTYGKLEPIEINCDLLNGWCFEKTKYLGFHPNIMPSQAECRMAGINIWRMMPMELEEELIESQTEYGLLPVTDAENDLRSSIGFLHGCTGKAGIARLRLAHVSANRRVHIATPNPTSATVHWPSWWPPQLLDLANALSNQLLRARQNK